MVLERPRDRAFLERMTVIPSGEAMLEGLYHSGDRKPAAVIAPPHPHMGGAMDSPVCAELAWAISQRGHATLRFNYKGVGASSGQAVGSLADVEDLEAAAEQLRESALSPRLALVGYSFGAVLAADLACRLGPVSHCVLVAPPTRAFPFDWAALEAWSGQLLVVLPEHDSFADRAVCEPAAEAAGATLRVIGEADHFFNRGLAELGQLVAGYLLTGSAG